MVISFLACGKSKGTASEIAEATEALDAYVQAIEENSTDCNKMAKALEKPMQNLAKVIAKTSVELKDKKAKLTKEDISARDRIAAASTKALIQCARHPRITRLFETFQLKVKDTD